MELVTRTSATQHLHGAPVARISRKADLLPTFPKGRICSEPGCDTILNQYHEGPECHGCWLKGLPGEEREAA